MMDKAAVLPRECCIAAISCTAASPVPGILTRARPLSMASRVIGVSMVAPPRPRRLPRLLLALCAVVSSVLRGAGIVAKTFPTPPATTGPGAGAAGAAGGGVRTGVLIHGCHLGAKGWRSIMWGDERQQRLGRLPHGVRLAWEENACMVVIGTGASELDGVVEARYAVEYLTSNWEKLGSFNEAFSGVDLEKMREAVQPSLVAEARSQNTREELIEAGRLFRKENCDRIILVSSPTHLPRCLRDACSVWLDGSHHDSLPRHLTPSTTTGEHVEEQGATGHGNGKGVCDEVEGEREEAAEHNEEEGRGRRRQTLPPWRPVILASPSGTSYADYGPGDVAIVEPPHRGDSGHVLGDSTNTPPTSDSSDGPTSAKVFPPVPDESRRASTIVAGSGDSAAVNSKDVEDDGYALGEHACMEPGEAAAPALLLHELVALALRIGKGSEEQFRIEFQALLLRYTGKEKGDHANP